MVVITVKPNEGTIWSQEEGNHNVYGFGLNGNGLNSNYYKDSWKTLINANKNTKAKIVLNVDTTDLDENSSIYFANEPLSNLDSTDEFSKEAGDYFIWNFGDYKGTINLNQQVTGNIVAASATVNVNSCTLYGRAVANTVNQNNKQLIVQPYSNTPTALSERNGVCNHNYQREVTKEATCKDKGETTYTCTKCGYTYTEEIPINEDAHDWEVTVTKPATCAETGVEHHHCNNNSEHDYDVILSKSTQHTGTADTVSGKAATCTETGLTDGTKCSVCGKTIKEQETISALGHDFSVKVKTVEPTCTEQGYTVYKCSRCDATENKDFVPAAHKPVTDKAVAPTCTKTGLTEGSHCSVCSTVLVKQETVNALGHDLKPKVEVPATCTKAGVKSGSTCQREGCTYTEGYGTIAALGHDWGEWTTTKQPNCTEKGEKTHTCNRCKITEKAEIAIIPDAHNWDNGTITTDPTCTTAGVKTYTCKNNDEHKKTEEIKALGHNYQSEVTAPTCTEQGYTTHTCTRCKDSYKDTYVDATGHNYVGKVTKEATCTENGVKTYTCTKCGDSYTEVITAAGHKPETVSGKAATCTETGLTDGTKCSVCDKTIKEQEIIPTIDHTAGAEATCTTAQTCTVCGTVLKEALGHDYKDVVTAPTCTEQGYTTYTCSRCGDSYVSDYVPATGHKSVTDNAVAATCTETGLTEGSHCSVCNTVLVKQEVVPATGHKAGAAATCTTAQTCTVCGAELAKALGHDYQTKVTAPTCTEQGYTTHTCSRGDSSYVSDYTPATGHAWDNGKVTKAATTSAEGVKTYTCQNDPSHTYTEPIAKLSVDESNSVTPVSPAPVVSPEVTVSPEPETSPEPVVSPEAEVTPEPSTSPAPTASPAATATPAVTASPTATEQPAESPAPTASPMTPEQKEEQKQEAIDAPKNDTKVVVTENADGTTDIKTVETVKPANIETIIDLPDNYEPYVVETAPDGYTVEDLVDPEQPFEFDETIYYDQTYYVIDDEGTPLGVRRGWSQSDEGVWIFDEDVPLAARTPKAKVAADEPAAVSNSRVAQTGDEHMHWVVVAAVSAMSLVAVAAACENKKRFDR